MVNQVFHKSVVMLGRLRGDYNIYLPRVSFGYFRPNIMRTATEIKMYVQLCSLICYISHCWKIHSISLESGGYNEWKHVTIVNQT